MLSYLYHDQLEDYPKLFDTMFKDRAAQFRDRLNWEVSVDENGHERDEYDDLNPLYAIWVLPDGSHGGSMRILPTTGNVMVNDYFLNVIGNPIRSSLIWESTRFCMSQSAQAKMARISAGIMLAGCEVGLNFGLEKAVAIFDPRMVRIYRKLGWAPKLLGSVGEGRHKICAGTWEFTETMRRNMARQAGISADVSTLWFKRSFGALSENIAA